MNKSTEKYIKLVKHLDEFADSVNIPQKEKQEFLSRTSLARRIIITGTGTSLPTAQYLTSRLQLLYPDKPVYFLTTAKAIRMADQANKNDVFIVISYGLNRADALIILEKAVRNCKTITISGNPDVRVNGNLNVVIPPKDEKIFCRPVSPLTTLLVINQLCGNKQNKIQRLNVINKLASELEPSKQTIILYTADVSFAAELWGIVLREGVGMNVSIKDVENYSHGYYGPDTAHLDKRQFIIIKSSSKDDARDFERAKGLYTLNHFKKFIITAHGTVAEANATLFREVPELVAQLLIRTGYDMYAPNGMEENRRYHEYEHFTDY